jgi:hypothetical protein
MQLPEYITKAEVQRVCTELGIRDWTTLTKPEVTLDEARRIQAEIGGETAGLTPEQFRQGLEVELEHGITFPDANVTNNHPLLTGKIVLAHLKEMLDYYDRLNVAELEGDLLKATRAGSAEKVLHLYRRTPSSIRTDGSSALTQDHLQTHLGRLSFVRHPYVIRRLYVSQL